MSIDKLFNPSSLASAKAVNAFPPIKSFFMLTGGKMDKKC
jgi:hypothetical protein